jgi:starch synthase (maltosyl-transferring)
VVRDWDAPGNIKSDVRTLNRIRRDNPALRELGNIRFLRTDYEGIVAYRKHVPGNDLVVIVNLDPHHVHETLVHLPLEDMGLTEDEPFEVEDLLSGERHSWRGRRAYVRLEPAEKVGHVMRVDRRG